MCPCNNDAPFDMLKTYHLNKWTKIISIKKPHTNSTYVRNDAVFYNMYVVV